LNLLIVDTETSGVDPTRDHVVEVAAVLFSVRWASVIRAFSTILPAESNAAEPINRIPAGLLRDQIDSGNVWGEIAGMASHACAFVAHSAQFDKSFFQPQVAGLLPWICTLNDVDWPRNSESRSLVAICLEHGLGISHAHRALTDCFLITRLFERVAEREGPDGLQAMIERAMRPKTRIVAIGSREQNELFKKHKFRWGGYDNPPLKEWYRFMPIEDVRHLPFRTKNGASFQTANPARGNLSKGDIDL
jgi:DNA polymerase-3 subunit epsilon